MTTDMVCSPDGAGGGSILAQHVHGPSNAASPQGPTYLKIKKKKKKLLNS